MIPAPALCWGPDRTDRSLDSQSEQPHQRDHTYLCNSVMAHQYVLATPTEVQSDVPSCSCSRRGWLLVIVQAAGCRRCDVMQDATRFIVAQLRLLAR